MNETEFNALVLNHSETLKPFAVSLTRDRQDADDLCQETLFRALAYREKYEPGTNINAWLCTIMRNIFINSYRRSMRKKGVLQTISVSQSQDFPSSEVNIRMKEIKGALYSLPSIFRNACLLYLQGYKYQEIAFALNEPLGTIKSRIHFAKKNLQKQLDR